VVILRAVLIFLCASWLRAQAPQPTPPEEAALQAKAQELIKEGRAREAIAVLEEMAVDRERRLGPKNLAVAVTFHIVATAYWRANDFEGAERCYAKALTLAEEVLGPDNKELLNFLHNYAIFKLREDQYPQAKELLQRAASLTGADAFKPLLNSMADFRLAGDYVRAEWLCRYAIEYVTPISGTDNGIGATLFNQLAILLSHRGDVDQARELYRKALVAAEKEYGSTSIKLQPFLFNLAEFLKGLGDSKEAEALYRRALANSEADPSDKDGIASNLSNLGVFYLETNHMKEAQPLLARALEIRKGEGTESRGLAIVHLNLASLYEKNGNRELAESSYLEALRIAEKYVNTDRLMLSVLGEAATFYMEIGKKDKADELFARAADLDEKGSTNLDPELAEWFSAVATQYLKAGDCERALSYAQRGERVRERNVELLMTAGSQEQRQRYLDKSSIERSILVSLQTQCFSKRHDVALLGFDSILQQKGRSVDAFADQLSVMRQRATPVEQKLFRDYADVAAHIAAMEATKGASQAAEVAGLSAKLRDIEADISSRSAAFRYFRQRPSYEQVRDAVPNLGVLVELFVHYDVIPHSDDVIARYMAYVVKRGYAVPALVKLGDLKDINAKVAEWRKALSDPSRADVGSLGAALYEQLIGPLQPHLAGVKHIIFAPDGQLAVIPFGAW